MSANFVSLSATTQVKVGLGKLKGIFVSSGTAPTVAVYDSATASTADPIILNTFTAATPGNYVFTGDADGVGFSKGLYVVIGGTTPKVSVFYE
ncbi:hypothetical protein [Sphingorhabdus sp.]|uniref:hypothetical protein n=1 Tax=Sphingorhabdus sp. TaxID=1902408 RepID=UPI00333E24EA